MLRDLATRDQTTIIAILNNFQNYYHLLGVPLVSYNDLKSVLNKRQQEFLISFFGSVNVKDQPISNDHFVIPDHKPETKQFVRVEKTVYKAYRLLASELEKATSEKLVIISGYRSFWYQAVLLLASLYDVDFDLKNALQFRKLPLESQHCQFPKHALDLSINNGKKITIQFSETDAYSWLVINAPRYGFHNSYPKNNLTSTIFEPWHWCYTATNQPLD